MFDESSEWHFSWLTIPYNRLLPPLIFDDFIYNFNVYALCANPGVPMMYQWFTVIMAHTSSLIINLQAFSCFFFFFYKCRSTEASRMQKKMLTTVQSVHAANLSRSSLIRVVQRLIPILHSLLLGLKWAGTPCYF